MESWSLVKLRLRLLLSSPEFLWSLWGKAASVEHAVSPQVSSRFVYLIIWIPEGLFDRYFSLPTTCLVKPANWCDESGVVAWLHSDRLLEQMSLPMPWIFSRVSALSNCFTMGHLASDPATLYTFYFQEMRRGSQRLLLGSFMPTRWVSHSARKEMWGEPPSSLLSGPGQLWWPQMSRVTLPINLWFFVEIHSDPIYVDMWWLLRVGGGPGCNGWGSSHIEGSPPTKTTCTLNLHFFGGALMVGLCLEPARFPRHVEAKALLVDITTEVSATMVEGWSCIFV